MIYMDYNATTPIHPEVVQAMLPFLHEGYLRYGNPSSAHQMGAVVREAVEKARASVAAVIGAKADEIYFTSGATEANNLAIRGFARSYPDACIMTSAVEHHAVLRTVENLRDSRSIVTLPVDERGELRLRPIVDALRHHEAPVLVSLMHANNETGNLLRVSDVANLLNISEGIVHVDGAQTFGKVPINVYTSRIDMFSISGHKIYGPKGIGALYVRKGTYLRAQITGGHQEGDLRAGTENVPGIVGLGRAAEIAAERTIEAYAAERCTTAPVERRRGKVYIAALEDWIEIPTVRGLTAKLHEGLSAIDGALFNSFPEVNVGNTVNVSFDQVDGEALVMLLDQRGICVSHGAACESGTPEPSHVLKAMGRTDEEASGAIRISLGIYTTLAEVEEVAAAIAEIVKELR